ncbi:MAG: 4-alpha-glucanotransferase [Candidatus Dormibacteria bacterium]|jgi:4-alpha-glucanotransferase
MTAPSPRAWGLLPHHVSTGSSRSSASAETVDALLAALGADRRRPDRNGDRPLVVVQGECARADRDEEGSSPAPSEVELEDGSTRACGERLPADLPLGYHRLNAGGRSRLLIVTPPRCHLPAARGFGFAVQLYATRSAASWGIGDLTDLAALAGWAAGLGAATLLVNPLHAGLPVLPIEPSPYFPTSRLFLDPLYLRPARSGGDTEFSDLAAAARLLNRERLIERDQVALLKMAALEREFLDTANPSEAEAALEARPRLHDFALFCALAERHGRDWRDWPRPLARRDPSAIRAAAAELAGRVRFHAWVQLQLDRQLEEAGAALPLIRDLAVGFHPGGADAWLWQDLVVPGVTVGAPPDSFNTLGQDWGIAAFDPWKLRAAGYAPLIETLRANLREGAGLRIDHVMGLQRLWCIPSGGGPADGCYLGYPAGDLLGIVALESVRHRATVIGEDLGTVPPGFRARLRRRGLLSYVVLLFEDRPPARWPRQALAAVTTHDLPTVTGLWDGSDLRARRRSGLPADASATEELVERIRQEGGPARDAESRAAVVHAHRRLAGSRCTLIAATLEDVAEVQERPNQPGSAGESRNWSLALPLPRERLQELPMARQLAGILTRKPAGHRRPAAREKGV